jgi:RNA polymerase sigma factor (sigma-70 family)
VDWIQYVKVNENEALNKLYLSYKEETVNWLQREFLCSQDEAMDIFQMVVVIFYDNVVTAKLTYLTSDIKTYLFGIARNKALELIRSKKKESDLFQNDIWVKYTIEEEPGVSEENVQRASIALDKLGNPCKSLLMLFYYEQKKMEEISQTLGYKNVDTAKNQKYKCLKRLQTLFFQHQLESQRIEKQ